MQNLSVVVGDDEQNVPIYYDHCVMLYLKKTEWHCCVSSFFFFFFSSFFSFAVVGFSVLCDCAVEKFAEPLNEKVDVFRFPEDVLYVLANLEMRLVLRMIVNPRTV